MAFKVASNHNFLWYHLQRSTQAWWHLGLQVVFYYFACLFPPSITCVLLIFHNAFDNMERNFRNHGLEYFCKRLMKYSSIKYLGRSTETHLLNSSAQAPLFRTCFYKILVEICLFRESTQVCDILLLCAVRYLWFLLYVHMCIQWRVLWKTTGKLGYCMLVKMNLDMAAAKKSGLQYLFPER